MSVDTSDLTVRKTINVACSVERAFETFTAGIAGWWPLATHSMGDEHAAAAVFEGSVGGRIYEVWDDGSEHEWGSVVLWEPPGRVVFSWNPNPNRTVFTEVEVRFAPEGDGTRVELEHRGWERLGDEATAVHGSYVTGWDTVLGHYRSAIT